MLSKVQRKVPSSCLFFAAPRITREAEALLRTELLNSNPSLDLTFLSNKLSTRILGYPCYPGRIFALYHKGGFLIVQGGPLLAKYFQSKPELLFLVYKDIYLDTSFVKKIQNPLQRGDLLCFIVFKKLLLLVLLKGYLIYNIAYLQSVSSRYTS